MTDFVRVKQGGTGHELSLPSEHVEVAEEGAYTVLDKPAVDEGGTPLPPKFHTTVSQKAAEKKSGQKADHKEES